MPKETIKHLRNQADTLLQEITKIKHKYCLVCSEPVNCGHHFFTKASSNALRYYPENIIPLCKKCHCLVHSQPWLIEPKICFMLGKEWYEDLLREKKEGLGIKVNKLWYQEKLSLLKGIRQTIQ